MCTPTDRLPASAGRLWNRAVEAPVTDRQPGLIATATELPGATLTRGRLLWSDGTFSDFGALRCPASLLTLRDFDQRDPIDKINMIGHLRFVKTLARDRLPPRIVLWLRLAEDQPAAALFPGIAAHTDNGETLLSANSLITYTLRQLVARGWLRCVRGAWEVVAAASGTGEEDAARRGTAVVAWLQDEGRLHLFTGPWPTRAEDDLTGVHPTEDVIPVDRLGYVRELTWRENPLAAFNTAFFLLEHNDFISHHSGLGEPYDLFVAGGQVRRPPLYRRSALFQRRDGGWEIGAFGLADLALCAGEFPLPFVVDTAGPVTAYTRRWAIAEHGRVIGFTPPAAGRHEFTIIDTRVVGHKIGGELEIPQNGFVLSCAASALPADATAALLAGQVSYRFHDPALAGMRQAVQAGPRLIADSQVCLSPTSLADEAFWPDRFGPDGRREVGVVPTDYPADIDVTRAGRLGLGLTPEGELLAVAIAGTEARATRHPQIDSAGATLVELAAFMAELGAADALNMDGGGSTQLFFCGGLTTPPGNRLGLPSVYYERPVPSVGVVGWGVS